MLCSRICCDRWLPAPLRAVSVREEVRDGPPPEASASKVAGAQAMSGAGPQLSVGVLTADLTRLGDELSILHGTGCWAHIDVMDGAFCPQLTVGPAVVAAVASTGLPVDVHLMVDEPMRILPEIVAAGPAVGTGHAEATRHLHRTLQELAA